MSKCRTLFIDESGKPYFSHHSKNFILSACSIPTDNLEDIRHGAQNIIFKYWGSYQSYSRKYKVKNIAFHASDIASQSGPFLILRNQKINKEFWQDLRVQIVNRSDITFYICLFDKVKAKKETPAIKPETILRNCYTTVIEAFLEHLIKSKLKGEIIAESTFDQDISLVSVLNNLQRNSFTKYKDSKLVSEKITSLSLVNKHDNEIGAQIADLIAWTGENKYLIQQRYKKTGNLTNEKKKLLEAFNSRLNSKSPIYKHNKFFSL